MTEPRTSAGRALLNGRTVSGAWLVPWAKSVGSDDLGLRDAILAIEAEAARIDPERLALLEKALMVNMRVRQDEVDLWARRLVAADARVLRPWLSDPAAAYEKEQA